tara:strand:- start:456 stop:893 length:438 start_codon:yes stop_codon:yes gene_type:complete
MLLDPGPNRMKITKSQLKELIEEELSEMRGFVSPFAPRDIKGPAPEPADVLNAIVERWPRSGSSQGQQIDALKDIYRYLDQALVGTGRQKGLMDIKEDHGPGSEEPHWEAYKKVQKVVRDLSQSLNDNELAKLLELLEKHRWTYT